MKQDRLSKVLGKLGKLGSDSDHEILVAAKTVEELRSRHGLTWENLTGLSLADGAVKDRLLAEDRRLGNLHQQDQRAFIDLRDRFFEAGCLEAPDLRRHEHFHSLACPTGTHQDDTFPF